MQTSNHAPMLGARTPNAGYKPYKRRGDAPRPWADSERRDSKNAEREQIVVDVTEELGADPDQHRYVFVGTADFDGLLFDALCPDFDEDAYRQYRDEDEDRDSYDALDFVDHDDDDPPTVSVYGDGLSWEDLQTLTITRTPYLWSSGR